MYQKSWGSSLPQGWLEEMEKSEDMIVDRAVKAQPVCRASEHGLGVAGVVEGGQVCSRGPGRGDRNNNI